MAPAAQRFPWVALAAAAIPFVLLSLFYFEYRVDDAFIVLRYADNLQHGLGMTFNPGERVEGFTCPALVVFEAVMMRLGADALLAAKLLGIASGIVIIGATMTMTMRLTGSMAATVFAGVLIAVQPALAVSAVNGLETAPFSACIAGALALYLGTTSTRRLVAVGALLGLSFLLRPEGALALALIAIDLLVRDRRRLGALVGPFLLVSGPLYLWKALYYGSLTPNTALAKVPAQLSLRLASGGQYLLQFSASHWDWVAWLCLAGLAVAGVARFRTLAWIGFVWLAYVASTGGDWMPHGRFLVPLLPIAATSLSTAIQQLWSRLSQRPSPARVWVPYVFFGVALIPSLRRDVIAIGSGASALTGATLHEALPLGRWLRDAAPTATAAMLDIGAAGDVSGLKIIDTGGLTDPKIARIIHDHGGHYAAHLYMPDEEAARTIADETLGRRPEIVVAMMNGAWPETRGTPAGAYPQDTALLQSPRLSQEYRYVCHVPGTEELDGSRWDYNVFARKDVILAKQPATDAHGDRLCL